MNTKNNRRRQETVNKIETVFMEFLKTKELSQIKVSAICKKAEINRGTFYANFIDIYDLAEKLHTKLKNEVNQLFEAKLNPQYTEINFLSLFQHIKENQDIYSFYFKLGYDDSNDLKLYDIFQDRHNFRKEYIDYHIAFFKGGFNTIVKKWLAGGCKETPCQMRDILLYEYRDRFN